jgi:uncharacterized membrane protein
MYPLVLTLHSIVRWLVVIFAILALVRLLTGWLGRRDWKREDERSLSLYTIVLDVQTLLGLILYFISPTTTALLSGATGMSNALARFFGVEHVFLMVLALIAAHMARPLARRGKTDTAKFRWAALLVILSVVLVLAAIPWPFSPAARPWIRFGF